MTSPLLRSLFAGMLTRDYAILPSGKVLQDVPGGNLLYAASGYAIWESEYLVASRSEPQGEDQAETQVEVDAETREEEFSSGFQLARNGSREGRLSPSRLGLLARVGEDYPHEWLEDFARRGFDVRGIRVLPEVVDLRSFYVYIDPNTRVSEDPVAHYARLGLAFPKALLGYRPPAPVQDSRTRLNPTSLRQADIPPDYLDAGAAHLCPVDYLTHSLLPAILRQSGFTTVTMDPSPGYMNPIFWNDVPALVSGLTAFLPAEEEIRALFHGRSTDLWEMAEALAVYGCEVVAIKRGLNGQFLYDSTSRSRWEIPAYPARLADPTGGGHAFCGGFLVGYRRTYDPLEAALHGNISASLAIEGHGPFYALDALPGLALARLAALREGVRKV